MDIIKRVIWKSPVIIHRAMKKAIKYQIIVLTCEVNGLSQRVNHWLWVHEKDVILVECSHKEHTPLYVEWRFNEST